MISDVINTQICAVGIFQTIHRHFVASYLIISTRILRHLEILADLLTSLYLVSTVTHLSLCTAYTHLILCTAYFYLR
jgi:hypothetical protein